MEASKSEYPLLYELSRNMQILQDTVEAKQRIERIPLRFPEREQTLQTLEDFCGRFVRAMARIAGAIPEEITGQTQANESATANAHQTASTPASATQPTPPGTPDASSTPETHKKKSRKFWC